MHKHWQYYGMDYIYSYDLLHCAAVANPVRHRKIIMKLPILQVASSLLGCTVMSTYAAPEKPNVIVLYYDDMGYGDMGANAVSPHESLTPNLDKFATESMRFTAGHSADGVCTPSRYALITGRYCWRTSLKWGVTGGYSKPLMEKDRFTIGQMFREQGYNTAMIGKWHVGMQFLSPDGKAVDLGNQEDVLAKNLIDFSKPLTCTPADHGFDYYFGTPASLDMPPYLWLENHQCLVKGAVIQDDGSVDFTQAKPARNADLKEGHCPGGGRKGAYDPNFAPKDYLQIQAAKVQQYLAEHAGSDKPFFIYIPMPAPHTPWSLQAKFKGKAGFKYGDYVIQTDYYSGKIFDALEDPNGDGDKADSVKGNTVGFVSSDNGPETMAQSISLKNKHDANGPFAVVKRDNGEGGTRVPFLIRWPNVVKAGSVSDHACWQGDFLATMADYFDYDLGETKAPDTESFLPVLHGKPMPEKRRAGFIEHSSGGQFAIVDASGEWKLLDGTGGGGNARTWNADDRLSLKRGKKGGTPKQLFNLKMDPGERKNLLKKPNAEAQAKAKELMDALSTIRSND